MVDRDGKKPFIIPKAHTSSKDVLVCEKTDSRNVTDLFRDIQSCALEIRFNFRQSECKSCDTIRNPRLQKLFNESRLQMKKDLDPVERLAFQIISTRDMASQVATEGLTCAQTTLPIARYLGNPTDGIHLSRRPDILLASTGSRSLQKFGLLICKILLGKGYATIPAANNKELPAQLHHDHHFCKIQTGNNEQQNIDELLANSLIFCYEHDDMQTLSHPTQILPLAILWYDLTRPFSTQLSPPPKQSQQRTIMPLQRINSLPPKRTVLPAPHEQPPPSSNGTWEKPPQDPPANPSVPTTPPQYPGHCLIPFSSLYTPFSSMPQPAVARDPRITRAVATSETIPLSPQKSLLDHSPSPSKLFPAGKPILLKDIPLTTSNQLTDPRLSVLKHTRDVCYLEGHAVRHALQQQRRLNQYYDSKHGGLSKKTSYTPIPLQVRSFSAEEYERQNRLPQVSPLTEYSSLQVSVIDCFDFGLKSCGKEAYVDLEDNTNRMAYSHMQMSDQLLEHEQQLNSHERRLQLREQRQRKMQEQLNARRKLETCIAKTHINNGQKLLAEHQPVAALNNRMTPQVLDFLSCEYRQESRPQVKRILAELLGIFVEKYGVESNQTADSDEGVSDMNVQTNDVVVDMDIESPSSQAASDHDERFPIQTIATVESSSDLAAVPTDQAQQHTNGNNEIRPPESPSASQSTRSSTDLSSKHNTRESGAAFNEIPVNDGAVHRPERIVFSISSSKSTGSGNPSRDEFVKLLAKEACISESPSPLVSFDDQQESDDSSDDEDTTSSTRRDVSSARTVTIVSTNHKDKLIIQATHVEHQSDEEEPTVKRAKISPVSPAVADADCPQVITDDRDYRQDHDERSAIGDNRHGLAARSRSESTSSHNSSVRESQTRSPAAANRPPANAYPFPRQQRRDQYNHEHHRSFDTPAHVQQRNVAFTPRPTIQPTPHQKFNYNHQSAAQHSRFANVNAIPSLMTPPHQGLVQLLPNINYQQPPPIMNINQNFLPLQPGGLLPNPQYFQDTFASSLFQLPPPLMAPVPLMNFPNSLDLKPSNTFERLQMILQDRSGARHEVQLPIRSDFPSALPMVHSYQDGHNAPRTSTRFSPNMNASANKQNNPTFSRTDANQLLTFVQHFRH